MLKELLKVPTMVPDDGNGTTDSGDLNKYRLDIHNLDAEAKGSTGFRILSAYIKFQGW